MQINYSHIKKEYDEILKKLESISDSSQLAKLGKRQSELLPMVNKIDRIDRLQKEITEHEKLIAEKYKLF